MKKYYFLEEPKSQVQSQAEKVYNTIGFLLGMREYPPSEEEPRENEIAQRKIVKSLDAFKLSGDYYICFNLEKQEMKGYYYDPTGGSLRHPPTISMSLVKKGAFGEIFPHLERI